MSIRILIVDDEPETAQLLEEVLEAANQAFQVERVGLAEQALQIIGRGGADCVLLDYKLPDLDGLECLTRIRARQPDLPVLIITGAGSEELVVEALMQRHATNYVAKRRNYLPSLLRRVQDALTRALFRADHGGWRMGYAGREVTFPERVGFRCLHRLLVSAGQPVSATELLLGEAALPGGGPLGATDDLRIVTDPGREDRLLDARGRRQFSARLSELGALQLEARQRGDVSASERVEDEIEALRKLLYRDRRSAGGARSWREKARVGVKRAIDRALGEIEKQLPSLHRHLKDRIRTGTACIYVPDPTWPINWAL